MAAGSSSRESILATVSGVVTGGEDEQRPGRTDVEGHLGAENIRIVVLQGTDSPAKSVLFDSFETARTESLKGPKRASGKKKKGKTGVLSADFSSSPTKRPVSAAILHGYVFGSLPFRIENATTRIRRLGQSVLWSRTVSLPPASFSSSSRAPEGSPLPRRHTWGNDDSSPSDPDVLSPKLHQRCPVAVAILFGGSAVAQSSLCAHFTLFESLFMRACSVVRGQIPFDGPRELAAGWLQGNEAVRRVMKQFSRSLQDFANAKRFTAPSWLAAHAFPEHREDIQKVFLDSLSGLFSSKETKELVVSAVTALCTRSTFWMDHMERKDTTARGRHGLRRKGIQHPSQLFVSTDGFVCRFIAVGRDFSRVRAILTVASFFLRCSGCLEQVFTRDEAGDSADAGLPIVLRGEEPRERDGASLLEVQDVTMALDSAGMEDSSTGEGATDQYQQSGVVDVALSVSTPVFRAAAVPSLATTYGSAGFANILSRYSPLFFLQGLPSFDFLSSLLEDLPSFLELGGQGCRVNRSSAIVCDSNQMKTEVLDSPPFPPFSKSENGSGHSVGRTPLVGSQAIARILSSAVGSFALGVSPGDCVRLIDSGLESLWHRGLALAEHIAGITTLRVIFRAEMEELFGEELNEGDVALLVAIARRLRSDADVRVGWLSVANHTSIVSVHTN